MPTETDITSFAVSAPPLTLPQARLLHWMTLPGHGCTETGRLLADGQHAYGRTWRGARLPSSTYTMMETLQRHGRFTLPAGESGRPGDALTLSADGQRALVVARETFAPAFEADALEVVRGAAICAAEDRVHAAMAQQMTAVHSLLARARAIDPSDDDRLTAMREWQALRDADLARAAAGDMYTAALALPGER